ncbi:MAG: hypothetical protein KKE73_12980 [Proteobacteria bacterium]|nr:hypothetical protein [Pseudomonadota bacterium]
MAKIVMLKHPDTGIVKKGFFGFSWTTFFFAGFPALFRGDIVMGVLVTVLSLLTWGLAGNIWAFFYNKHYTTKLLAQGYEFADSEEVILSAKVALGIDRPSGS